MTERRTYEAVLIERGDVVLSAYTCACCGYRGPAFSLAETLPEDALPHPFACAECILSAHREQEAATHAAAQEAAGVDWSPVRAQRDAFLTRCDWTQMPDAPLDEAQRELWRVYRQQLRDLSEQFDGATNPDDLSWPTPPA